MSNLSVDGMSESPGFHDADSSIAASSVPRPVSTPQDSQVANSATDEPGMNAPMTPPGPTWFQRLSAILFIIFCFELGLFLLVYPWTESWSSNYFAWAVPGAMQTTWHTFWQNTYTRGGVSGIGIVNIWIAMMELFRMFRDRHRGHQ